MSDSGGDRRAGVGEGLVQLASPPLPWNKERKVNPDCHIIPKSIFFSRGRHHRIPSSGFIFQILCFPFTFKETFPKKMPMSSSECYPSVLWSEPSLDQQFLRGKLYSMVEASTQGRRRAPANGEEEPLDTICLQVCAENHGPQCSAVCCSGLEPRLWKCCFISLRAQVLEQGERFMSLPLHCAAGLYNLCIPSGQTGDS